MNQLQDKSFLYNFINSNQTNYISPINFFLSLIITVLLSILIAFIYTRFGRNISNRKEFSSNFTFLSLTTMLIITIVKSSLALSLGLVGALSIVRFRTAIKDPEELNYLFFSIAIGLGIGANQVLITIFATLFISIYTIIKRRVITDKREQFVNLILSMPVNSKYNFEEIVETISKYSNHVNVKRFTQEKDLIESLIFLNIKSFSLMSQLRNNLTKNFNGITIDFIDNADLE